MLFLVRQVEITCFSKGSNTTDLSEMGIISGKVMLRYLFIYMDKESVFHGNIKEDPFSCQDFVVQQWSLE